LEEITTGKWKSRNPVVKVGGDYHWKTRKLKSSGKSQRRLPLENGKAGIQW